MSTIISAPNNAGLVGYWSFDDIGDGNTAHDFSGNGNHGQLVNSPQWVDGILGKALRFNGINQSVILNNYSFFNLYPITICCWIKTSRNDSNERGIINKYLSASQNGYQLFMYKGQVCAWYFKDSSNKIYSGSSTSLSGGYISDNQYHFICFIVDSSGGRMYVDGGLKNSLNWTGIPGATTSTNNLKISAYDSDFFIGDVDDVRIYNRALTQNEITTLYNSGATKLLAATNSGLVGHWTFDDIGNGNTAHDFSGNGNHGTLVNSPTWVDGILGKAMRFNGAGSGEGINLGISSSINNALNDKFSICYWIKRTGSNNQVIFGKKNATHSRMIGYNIWAASSQSFVDENQAVKLSIVDNYANLWTYWIWIYNGTLLTAFINGKQVGQVSTSFSASYNNNSFIGYNGAITSQSFTGLLDDIRIYNRALNQSEITTLYNAGLSKLS